MITIDAIKRATAEYFSLPIQEMTQNRPTGTARRAKHIAMCLSCALTSHSLRTIAREFHLGDHSGVVYAKETIQRRTRRDGRCLEQILAIESRLISAHSEKVSILAISGKNGSRRTYLDEAQSLRVSEMLEEMGLQWVA